MKKQPDSTEPPTKKGLKNKSSVKELTRDQKYYKELRNDPVRWELYLAMRRKYYKESKEYRLYLKKYMRTYQLQNKEKINARQRSYPDKTRNERIKKHWAKQRDNLTDKYIMSLLTRRYYWAKDVTPEMIEQKREEVIAFRKKKQNKQ